MEDVQPCPILTKYLSCTTLYTENHLSIYFILIIFKDKSWFDNVVPRFSFWVNVWYNLFLYITNRTKTKRNFGRHMSSGIFLGPINNTLNGLLYYSLYIYKGPLKITRLPWRRTIYEIILLLLYVNIQCVWLNEIKVLH